MLMCIIEYYVNIQRYFVLVLIALVAVVVTILDKFGTYCFLKTEFGVASCTCMGTICPHLMLMCIIEYYVIM